MATGSSYQVEELDSNTGLFLCKDQALSPIPSHFIRLLKKMDWVPSKSLQQSSTASTEAGEPWVNFDKPTSSQEKGEAGQNKMLGVARVAPGQPIFGFIWEESHGELGVLRYAERKRKKISYPKCRMGERMMTWGKLHIPSYLRRTTAIKTTPHLYLDMFEHVRYGSYSVHKYLLMLTKKMSSSLVSWHLQVRYSPILIR